MSTTNPRPTEAADATCFFCGQAIGDGHWFARLKQGPERVVFCRPRCVEAFLDQSRDGTRRWPAATNGRGTGPG